MVPGCKVWHLYSLGCLCSAIVCAGDGEQRLQLCRMVLVPSHEKQKDFIAFHDKNYGPNFQYQQFEPQFTASMFDPKQWADIFKRSGAKYVVLTSKHHEGYCLWNSTEADRDWGRPWNAVTGTPHRDLLRRSYQCCA